MHSQTFATSDCKLQKSVQIFAPLQRVKWVNSHMLGIQITSLRQQRSQATEKLQLHILILVYLRNSPSTFRLHQKALRSYVYYGILFSSARV